MKKAFTLAEVLITLGIIGIVAAMTMPTLIEKHRKHEYAIRAKEAYSIMSQAIKLSEVENGDVKYWETNLSGSHSFKNTDMFYKKYILPYLKGYKYCASGKSEDTKKKCGLAPLTASHTYFLNNGVAIALQPMIGSSDTIFNLSMDVNGPLGPNKLGNDHFQFYLYKKYGKLAQIRETSGFTGNEILQGKEVVIDGTLHYVSCKKSKSDDDDYYYRHGCTALLIMDGWELKDDYPW